MRRQFISAFGTQSAGSNWLEGYTVRNTEFSILFNATTSTARKKSNTNRTKIKRNNAINTIKGRKRP
jgi:hypothetical protein